MIKVPIKLAKRLGILIPAKKRVRPKQIHPDLEGQFRKLWEHFAADAPKPVEQFCFLEDRKCRFDFAWPTQKVAVEIDGGIFQGKSGSKKKATGHRSITGVMRDMEKMNIAQLAGWIVLRFHRKDLDDAFELVVKQVLAAIKGRSTPSDASGGGRSKN